MMAGASALYRAQDACLGTETVPTWKNLPGNEKTMLEFHDKS